MPYSKFYTIYHMHVQHECPILQETYNFRGVPEVRKSYHRTPIVLFNGWSFSPGHQGTDPFAARSLMRRLQASR